MRRVIKLSSTVIAIIIVLGGIFYLVDNNKVLNGEKPVFCYDASGGSIILYFGLGYVIHGAYDDVPGGLENAKIYTWIDWLQNT